MASMVQNNRCVQSLFREEKIAKEAFLKRLKYAAFNDERAIAMLEQVSRGHFEGYLADVESGILRQPSSRKVITLSDVLRFCTGMRKFSNSEEEYKIKISFKVSSLRIDITSCCKNVQQRAEFTINIFTSF
jgi:hypothetical protein